MLIPMQFSLGEDEGTGIERADLKAGRTSTMYTLQEVEQSARKRPKEIPQALAKTVSWALEK